MTQQWFGYGAPVSITGTEVSLSYDGVHSKNPTWNTIKTWVNTGVVAEAPSDSTAYVRKNAAWVHPAQTDVSGTLGIANGGTSATTAAAALAALGGTGLASPAFTGTPTAPTAAVSTNTTQLATTAFVSAAISSGGAVLTTDPRFYGIERTDLAAKYGAPLDGSSHPLSAMGLSAAQAAYPNIGLSGATNLSTFERDTAAWLQAEYDLRTGAGGIIGLRDGAIMRVSSQLFLQDGYTVWFHGGRDTTLLTESTGSTAPIRVTASRDGAVSLRNLIVLAYNSGERFVSASLGGVAHTSFRSGSTAFALDNCAGSVFEGVHWNAFDTPFAWGDNTYIVTFKNIKATANNIGINWSQTTGLNSMEKMRFDGGTCANNNTGIVWDTTYSGLTQGGSTFISDMSIDYNVIRHIVYVGQPSTYAWCGNSFHVSGCHLETTSTCSGSSNPRVSFNGKAFMSHCELYEGDATVPPGYVLIADNSAASMINCSVNNATMPLFWSSTGFQPKHVWAAGNYMQDTNARPVLLRDGAGTIMQPTSYSGGVTYSSVGADPNPGPYYEQQGCKIILQYAASGNFTLTNDATYNHFTSTVFEFTNTNSFTVTFVAGAGVTLDATPGARLVGNGKSCWAMKTDHNKWTLRGSGLS